MTKNNNATARFTGLRDREEEGEYLGETVQVIPHITDEIKIESKYLTYQKKDMML